ncbi:hypothetical protein IW140_003764 [Coemansia sp. RSA 1813]|nr:Protein Aster-B [Coemansia sp. RSA 1646]KAJ1772794.1 hypothetical protein LPJ74_001133 [Coemansia sp. RSA 1843]KAJ2088660.1 hypothetical protein IW138_004042 [Coemansia sp. RSA 986]KAJ2213135.1 hypothetical protein EV179_004105 [Coemansia sp. RSA 487]KAJ2568558.1 hypothetical protein IW140_003764 [Coemansia sp. RSA 1813]
MTISAEDASVFNVAFQQSPKMPTSLAGQRSVSSNSTNRQPSVPRSHDTFRWFSKRSITPLFQKKQQQTEHTAADDCNTRHALRGRQVALKVAQRAASLARLLGSHKNISAKSLPAIDSNYPATSSSSSHSGTLPPLRAQSYRTYPTTSSIGQTLLMDSPKPALFGADLENSMPLQQQGSAAGSMNANTTPASTSRRQTSKSFSRLVQAFPDTAMEVHALRDFACSLDHAGIRWYGRIYVGLTHFYFTGTGISLSATGAPKTSSGMAQQTTVPLWPPAQCPSSISLASAPSSSQEYVPFEQSTRRPLYGPYSQPSRSQSDRMDASGKQRSLGRGSLPSGSQPTRLTFSMDEIPQKIRQSASQPSRRSNAGEGSIAKPWRRTAIKIALPDITRVTKELTLGIWPNAMTVSTAQRQYIFTNLLRRDKAYQFLYEVWNDMPAAPSQTQPQQRPKQRQHLPDRYTMKSDVPETQQLLAASLRPSPSLSVRAKNAQGITDVQGKSTLCQQNPQQSNAVECPTARTVAACHGYKEPPVAPPPSRVDSPAAAAEAEIDNQAPVRRQSKQHQLASKLREQPAQLHPPSPQQNASISSALHHQNNNHPFMWQRLDPIMLVGQLVGIVSQSTLFILLSLVVFCFLSSITFL